MRTTHRHTHTTPPSHTKNERKRNKEDNPPLPLSPSHSPNPVGQKKNPHTIVTKKKKNNQEATREGTPYLWRVWSGGVVRVCREAKRGGGEDEGVGGRDVQFCLLRSVPPTPTPTPQLPFPHSTLLPPSPPSKTPTPLFFSTSCAKKKGAKPTLHLCCTVWWSTTLSEYAIRPRTHTHTVTHPSPIPDLPTLFLL